MSGCGCGYGHGYGYGYGGGHRCGCGCGYGCRCRRRAARKPGEQGNQADHACGGQHKTDYEKGGKKFGLWKSKPFLALIMYQQMREAFGWEAYKKVFAEYRDLADYERPKNDDQKRDQWLVRMSKTVGKDLGPFFESWGIPVSKKAREAVKELPAWMPDNH